ncbi:MAG TPA: MMPL family transporter, partial [Verrucomicrobiae bacterium]|nr:MMPL family transporter [Verrucomicrobiae bacterium]
MLATMARVTIRYPWMVISVSLALFVVSLLVTLKFPGIEFDTNRDNLVGANKTYHQNYLAFRKEFPQPDNLVVVVESDDPEKNRQFVERLAAKVADETNLFNDVFFKGSLSMMGNKALLFVPQPDLVQLRDQLQSYSGFVQQFVRTTNLVSLFDMVNTQFRTAKREKSADTDSLINALPALERIVTQAKNSLLRRGVPPSPGVSALFDPDGKADQQIYVTFDNGRIYLLSAHAMSDDLNPAAVEKLRKLMNATKYEVPGVNAGLTGGPVLEHDEMEQSQKDMTLATIVSLVICALIFIYGYQQTGRPIKATACLVVGLAYTMAFATLVVGHLNILTITFLPMLIGLAIDFGVHLVTRFEEELHHGKSAEESLTKAMVYTGQGIFTGAFTTAGAFLAMGFTDFKGIKEMGIICGGGLMICLVPMMTLLPVLLLRGRQNVLDHKMQLKAEKRARIEQTWLDRPVLVTVITLVLCALAATQLHKLYFDYDLTDMQSKGLPAVDYAKKLINLSTNTVNVVTSDDTETNAAGTSVIFGVIMADTPEKAVELKDRLEKLPSVAKVETMAKYLVGDKSQELALIGQIKDIVKPVKFGEIDDSLVSVPKLSLTLYSLYGYLGAALDAVPLDQGELRTNLASLRGAIGDLRKEMLHGTDVELEMKAKKLTAFQQNLFDDLQDTFQTLQQQDNSAPLRVQDLPQALRDQFVGITGKFLLQVYPKKDVWQRDNQKEFVTQVESVAPYATGEPAELYEYVSLLKTSYEQAALYSLAAIALLVFIHFRTLGSVVLALLPVAIGSIWLCGLMGLFHVPFNPANIMTLPLVIGIGVTNGIHILNRFDEELTQS